MDHQYIEIQKQIISLIDEFEEIEEKDLLSVKELLQDLLAIIESEPFVYSYLRDVIEQLEKKIGLIKYSENLFNVVKRRMEHFHHWISENNQTIELINEGIIPIEMIKPHIRLADKEYELYYQKQNQKLENKVNKHKNRFNRFKKHEQIKLKANYNHCIRKTHALNVIETHMAMLDRMDLKINRKWLDIGCGNGVIANSVDPDKFTAGNWKIFGCDIQSNKIKIANNRACKNRHFFQENVFNNLEQNINTEQQYDILSMFEFLEHFTDPMSLLEDISKHKFKLMVIATPLNQKSNVVYDCLPDTAHLWSLSPNAITQMLKQLKLEVIYDSQIRVGSYTKGLDWLTVVACKKDIFQHFNEF